MNHKKSMDVKIKPFDGTQEKFGSFMIGIKALMTIKGLRDVLLSMFKEELPKTKN